MIVIPFADISKISNKNLGLSESILITQERIDVFAKTTEDEQWIHVDQQLAKAGPFGTTIAHGYLILSLTSKFVEGFLKVEGVTNVINYGLNRVRFISPVLVNSRIMATGEVISVESTIEWAQVTINLTINIENQKKPACVAEIVIRYIREINGP
jgi:acyl dehydratase